MDEMAPPSQSSMLYLPSKCLPALQKREYVGLMLG